MLIKRESRLSPSLRNETQPQRRDVKRFPLPTTDKWAAYLQFVLELPQLLL